MSGSIFRTNRDGPRYIVSTTTGMRTATVVKDPALSGPKRWIAYANWNYRIVTEPLRTKREAVERARQIITKD